MVMIELLEDTDNRHYVTFQYRNDSTRPPYQLILPGCAFLCPLAQFEALTSELRPGDWKAECNFNSDSVANVVTFVSVAVAAVLLLLLIVAVILSFCIRRSRDEEGTRYASLNQSDA